MKTSLLSALFCAISSIAFAQQTLPASAVGHPAVRHVYSPDGKLRLTVLRTATGLRVYRQVGTHSVLMR